MNNIVERQKLRILFKNSIFSSTLSRKINMVKTANSNTEQRRTGRVC